MALAGGRFSGTATPPGLSEVPDRLAGGDNGQDKPGYPSWPGYTRYEDVQEISVIGRDSHQSPLGHPNTQTHGGVCAWIGGELVRYSVRENCVFIDPAPPREPAPRGPPAAYPGEALRTE